MIAEIEFPAGAVFTPEQQETLRERALTGASMPNLEFLEDGKLKYYWTHFVMHIEDAKALGEFKVHRVLAERVPQVPEPRVSPPFNERVKIVVPGFGLLGIREVQVERDFCTDALQQRLKDGWCILAICPQPDQRRPDYILGRGIPESL